MSDPTVNMNDQTDEEIVVLIREGKDKGDMGFRILYARHSRWIYNKCIQFVGMDDAEDLTQEIFVKVYINLVKFQFASKFSTWLYTIVYRMCVDAAAKRKKAQEAQRQYGAEYNEDGTVSSWAETQVEEALKEMKFRTVQIILDTIDPGDKSLLLMKYQDDLSLKEIMAVTGLTEGALKMRLRRTKDKVLTLYLKHEQHETSI